MNYLVRSLARGDQEEVAYINMFSLRAEIRNMLSTVVEYQEDKTVCAREITLSLMESNQTNPEPSHYTD